MNYPSFCFGWGFGWVFSFFLSFFFCVGEGGGGGVEEYIFCFDQQLICSGSVNGDPNFYNMRKM